MKIKKCCGVKPVGDIQDDGDWYKFYLYCPVCHQHAPLGNSKDLAVSYWNHERREPNWADEYEVEE